MKFHCKQTRSGKLSSLNKFPLSPHIRHYILVASRVPHLHVSIILLILLSAIYWLPLRRRHLSLNWSSGQRQLDPSPLLLAQFKLLRVYCRVPGRESHLQSTVCQERGGRRSWIAPRWLSSRVTSTGRFWLQDYGIDYGSQNMFDKMHGVLLALQQRHS